MAKKPKKSPSTRSTSALKVRHAKGERTWELVHPRCAIERAPDLEEVTTMIDAGELEIARDELLWLLGGCNDFIDAHRLLGEIALTEGDTKLARGHFGIAFTLGDKAAQKVRGEFRYEHQANQGWLESGKGLIHCLKQIEELSQLDEVCKKMLRYDHKDPLGIRKLINSPAKNPSE